MLNPASGLPKWCTSNPGKVSPWFFEVLVTAEVVEDERFASISAPGVVYP
jgi:hypothetical protein